MVKISVVIDVENPSELVAQKEGKIKSWLANTFMSKRKLKSTVEKHMAVEVVKGLKDNIPAELAAQGVKARVQIYVDESD